MCSDAKRTGRTLYRIVLLVLGMLVLGPRSRAQEAEPRLRVCADPNNMPFSNARREGFENRLASLVARDLGRRVAYTWWPQRRGFVRHTLKAGRCDLVVGVPAGYALVRTTRAYYRSGYVFVTRRDANLKLRSLRDPRLRETRIGVHVIGDDYAAVPPMQALSMQGIVHNLRGYSIYGSYAEPDPPRGLIDAVARREVDVAIAWGPLGGYFAERSRVPLSVHTIDDEPDTLPVPMAYEIAMGVRREDAEMADALDRVIARRGPRIRRLLASYGIPLLPPTSGVQAKAGGG